MAGGRVQVVSSGCSAVSQGLNPLPTRRNPAEAGWGRGYLFLVRGAPVPCLLLSCASACCVPAGAAASTDAPVGRGQTQQGVSFVAHGPVLVLFVPSSAACSGAAGRGGTGSSPPPLLHHGRWSGRGRRRRRTLIPRQWRASDDALGTTKKRSGAARGRLASGRDSPGL